MGGAFSLRYNANIWDMSFSISNSCFATTVVLVVIWGMCIIIIRQWHVTVIADILLGTGCPIPDVDYLCLLCIDFYVWDAVSIFNHLPRMFLSTDFAFRITDWTCCHWPHLHAILRIISRSVSGLATDSSCGVWGRGWTTCLLHDSPLFGSHFKMRVGM